MHYIPEPVQYVIYALAVPVDLRCESSTLTNILRNSAIILEMTVSSMQFCYFGILPTSFT